MLEQGKVTGFRGDRSRAERGPSVFVGGRCRQGGWGVARFIRCMAEPLAWGREWVAVEIHLAAIIAGSMVFLIYIR